MLINSLISLIIFLTIIVIYQWIEKQRNRVIKKDLRDLLEVEKRQKDASMEFNAYFLNNTEHLSGVTLWINSKHYILYSNKGQATLEERSKGFTDAERIFYGAPIPDQTVHVN